MVPAIQKNTRAMLIVVVLVAASLACNIQEMFADADIESSTVALPSDSTEGSLNDEKEAELQAYMGTSQTELISVEPIESQEDCPPEELDLSPDGEVNHEISGDTLITTDDMGSREYTYDAFLDAFCRDVSTKMIINQDVVETKVTECVSFHTDDGVKVSNLKRYYLKSDVNILCYDQYNTIKNVVGDPSAPETEATLVEHCLAAPDVYTVEFAGVNRWGNPTTTKQVCDSQFTLRNVSDVNLEFRFYSIRDNGAMHSDGWGGIILGLGETFEDYFGTQTWENGDSTLNTFTKLIVGPRSQECGNFLLEENEAVWGDYVITLEDPCR